LRILLWHGYLLGGTGSNVYTHSGAREWSRAGHDVVVVCQEPNPELYDLGGSRRALGPDLTSFDTGDVADLRAKLDRLLALPPKERDSSSSASGRSPRSAGPGPMSPIGC
jgi:hypothetical protein